MGETDDIQQLISRQLAALPAVVRNAITSSEVEKNLRILAEKHKLHFDQWDLLEQEVIFALLGIHPVEELELRIMSEVGVPLDLAHALADDINTAIFEPIRQELERQLEHPAAQEKEVSDVETARNEALAGAATETVQTPAPAVAPIPEIKPATPPPPASEIKVTRPSESTAYKPGEPSSARTVAHDDPYRVPPV